MMVDVATTTARRGTPTARRGTRRLTPGRVLLYVTLSIAAVLMIAPFIWMLLTSLKGPAEVQSFSWLPQSFRWRNYIDAMEAAPFLTYFRNSLILTVGETALTLM